MKKFLAPMYPIQEKKVSTEQATDEWIWVEGYKGTDRNMQCRDFQFEIGKQFDIPEGEEIRTCSSGFHMCLKLEDVHKYYAVGNSNRFFRVRALVRKSEYEKYGLPDDSSSLGLYFNSNWGRIDKLVSKSIVFERELTVDEILEPVVEAEEFSDEQKSLAIEVGVGPVYKIMRTNKLVECGYSLPFAAYIESNGLYDDAIAVGSQPDLSMDMKCMIIFRK